MKHVPHAPGVSWCSSCDSSSVSGGGNGSGSDGQTLRCCLSPCRRRRSRLMVVSAIPKLQRMSLMVVLIWACGAVATVAAAAAGPRRTTATCMAAIRLERVDTLTYEKSGTIRFIDWYLDENLDGTNHSTTTPLHKHYNLQLVAATSLSMIQVWNQTISTASASASSDPNHHNILDRHRSSQSLVEHGNNWTLHNVIVNASLTKDKQIRCIVHSPVGQRAATAGDDGLIRIYRTNDNNDLNDSWSLIYTLDVMAASNNLTNISNNSSSSGNGNASSSSSIRSLAWHPTGRFLAVAGDSGQIECSVWNTITWKAVPLPRPILSTTSSSPSFATTASSDTTATSISAGTDATAPSQHVDWSPSGNQLVCGHVIMTLFDDNTNSTTATTASSTTTTTTTGSVLNNDTADTLLKPSFVNSTSGNGTASSSPLSRDTALLDTCLLCGLSTWSPDGKFIATAYGNQVHVLNGAPAVIVLVPQPPQLQPPSFESSTNSTLPAPTTATNTTAATTNISLDEAAYAQHHMVLQGGLLHNLTVPTDRERAYVMIQALAWSADARYLAVGGMGQAYIWVYDVTNWTHVPHRVETALGFGIEALAWRPLVPSSSALTASDDTNSSSASTTELVQYTQQLAVGTGRVIEIWNVHPQVNNESSNVTTEQADMTAAPTNARPPIAAPSAPTVITTTPTSTPNLAIEEVIRDTNAPTASVSLTNDTATTTGSNTSIEERAAWFNVATMSGISIAATIVAVGCAAVLFAWRLRVVVRNAKRRPHAAAPTLSPVLLEQQASTDNANGTKDQEDGNQAQNKHHKKDKRSHGHAANLVEPQEDLTGDSTNDADDEHFNRIIAIPCSDTMDSSDKSASGADLLWVGRIQH